jgi:hypothetical protein
MEVLTAAAMFGWGLSFFDAFSSREPVPTSLENALLEANVSYVASKR